MEWAHKDDVPYLKLRAGCRLQGQVAAGQMADGRRGSQNRISDSQNLGPDKDKSLGGFKHAAANSIQNCLSA